MPSRGTTATWAGGTSEIWREQSNGDVLDVGTYTVRARKEVTIEGEIRLVTTEQQMRYNIR
jgi:hypothetical protein